MTNMFQNVEPDLSAISEKYKNDPNEMVKALAHSQAHIQKLEAEAKERSTGKTLEEVLAELKAANLSVPNTPQSQETTISPVQSVLDDSTLEQKLNSWSAKKAEEDRINANKAEVQSTLLREFKDVAKASEAMANKARELGTTVQALDAIALNSPKALFKLFGIDSNQRQANVSPTMGNVRVNGLEQPPVDVHAKYRDLISTDRNKFNSDAVQKAIMDDAMRAAGIKR